MNIAKNMEAIFVAALVFAGSVSYGVENLPAAQAHNRTIAAEAIAAPGKVPVVTVRAKRMSAEEKAASLRAERAGSGV